MIRLPEDRFQRRKRRRHARANGAVVFALVLAALALIVLSRIDHVAVREIRQRVTEALAPALGLLSEAALPLRQLGQKLASYPTLHAELEQMRAENQRLKGWEARARELERQAGELRLLARVVAEPTFDFVTARVVGDAACPFGRTVLVNAGREAGLRAGFPAVNGDGLVGRIVETGVRASRVILLIDPQSRVPALIGKAGVRAVVAGDNLAEPRLALVPADAGVSVGDEVVSSGAGGLFARGLRIGTVVERGGVLRVALRARLAELEYVSFISVSGPTFDLVEDAPPLRPHAPRALAGRAALLENHGARPLEEAR